MPTVSEQENLPGSVAPERCTAVVQLYRADKTPLKEAKDSTTGARIVGRRVVVLDGANAQSPTPGAWSLPLVGNVNIVPSGTTYGRRVHGPQVDSTLSYGTVPASGGPYQWGDIETDPPAAIPPPGLAAHADNTTLHGGGRRLGIAHIANQTTASGSFVDLPGAALTFNNPNPATLAFHLELPISVVTIGQNAQFQVLAGSTVIGSRFGPKAQVANHAMTFGWRIPLPNTLYTPVAGAQVTYKVQWRNEGGTGGIAVVTEFGAPVNTGSFEAVNS